MLCCWCELQWGWWEGKGVLAWAGSSPRCFKESFLMFWDTVDFYWLCTGEI